MNEFNERRGQSPFYAIMAIMTLVVAAVGATFAWFTLQASNNSITGNVAKVGLSMSVTPLSTEATGDLIPLKQELLQNAVTGETGKSSCIDKNGNTQRLKLRGYDAMVVQHEIDHTNGIMFYDRINEANPFAIKEGMLIIE